MTRLPRPRSPSQPSSRPPRPTSSPNQTPTTKSADGFGSYTM
uniref:Uncharacterized protein n=1 Tax=Arundo donax TaxID=35708 RepID=A0A0A9ATJ9_ARUDO